MKKSINIPYWFIYFLMLVFVIFSYCRIAYVAGPTFQGLGIWVIGGALFSGFLGAVAISDSIVKEEEKNDD